jgi:hypothetical protein
MERLREEIAARFGTTDRERDEARSRVEQDREERASAPPTHRDREIEVRRRYTAGLAAKFGLPDPDPFSGDDGDQGED